MNETEFIELVLRYPDGAVTQSEVDALGAAMLERPELRALYRDLIQQAQLVHEWEENHPQPEPAGIQRRRPVALAIEFAAAAAAVIAASFFLLRAVFPPDTQTDNPPGRSLAEGKFFDDRNPSWSEIYHSPFDYPEFVWRAEISASSAGDALPDDFSDSRLLPLIAAIPTAEFSRLLAPIALLPGGDGFDRLPD
ncbi:MAG: hypothetical protein ACR2RV_14085 [Verrucomicrobiales bacterium]